MENKSIPDNKSKSSDMTSLSSLNVSNASATGSGRTKVALKPGHSLMDWIRLTHSGEDLTSTGGRILHVTSRELAKHNSKNDAWIALNGKVYNITPYLDYHPGGEDELMRGAGKDATDLFNQVHRWVNAESMLQKCYVGVLKKSWSLDAPRLLSLKPPKKQNDSKRSPVESNSISSSIEKKNGVSEWHIVPASPSDNGEISVSLKNKDSKLILKIRSSKIRLKEIITNLIKENLYIKLNKDSQNWLHIKFPCLTKNTYEAKFEESGKKGDCFELVFHEDECNGSKSVSNSSKFDTVWTLCDIGDKSIFWPCKLLKKNTVNYNTYLFAFLLPPYVKMWVPIGCHVSIKSEVEGMEVVRSYTPVISSLDIDEANPSDGSLILLMIKVYPSGVLTPLLNKCSIGETVYISSYVGSFTESVLKKSNSVIMLAAGTGITPMIRIIHWILNAKDKRRSLLLLFFNKTEKDILWKEEFENCSKKFGNFEVKHVLSESSRKFNGHSGTINDDILDDLLPPKQSDHQQILICGPPGFTSSALWYFEKNCYNQDYIHTFTG